MQLTTPPATGQEENSLDIAGYSAWDDPFRLENCPYNRSRDEIDVANLEKLWETGFDVEHLNDAHQRYHLSPLRSVHDIWAILGYPEQPMNPNGSPRFSDKDITSLAMVYPDPSKPGEVYPHTEFIRIRYPAPVRAYVRAEKTYTDHKYGQPIKSRTSIHSEPYFLVEREQWDRVFNPDLPLWITEGELKGAALGLAKYAGISFPGITMWAAPAKAGKHRLHPALDPQGLRQKWAIPIIGRTVFIVPDIDSRSNRLVRESTEHLGKALLDAGVGDVFTIQLPPPPTPGAWKGVDDYLTAHLGTRWAGKEDRVKQAGELLQVLAEHHSTRGNRTDWDHPATSPDRAALRMERRYRLPEKYTAVLVGESSEGLADIGWLTYKHDHYEKVDVYRTLGNTSGKVVANQTEIRRQCTDEWAQGVKIAREEGDVDGKVPGMPADFANRTLDLLSQRLDHRENETLIEPFGTVRPNDKCLRVRGGIINLNRAFECGVEWGRRIEWLLPPDYRWFGNKYLNVSLSNLPKTPECPHFMSLVHNAFNDDPERIACLQLWFGKIVCSPMFLGMPQQFLALYGSAGGGKSTFYRIFLKLLGDNSVAELRSSFGGRFDTQTLPGKQLIVYQETPDGVTGEFNPYMADIIKEVTGEDRIVCEAKGQKAVSHRINAEIMTIGNTPPTIPMNEDAFRRRACFLKVSKPIANRDKGVELRMMTEELPAILLWALQGACRVYNGAKVETPRASLEDLQDVTTSVAPEERFVTEMIVRKPQGFLTTGQIQEAYLSWALEHHLRADAPSAKKLGYVIRERFEMGSTTKSVDGKVQRVYLGLGLNSTAY